jgi:integrase
VWAKKIRGKLYYFGSWEDPQGALARYNEQAEALHSGRDPRPDADPDAATVKGVCNAFLNFKRARLESGELSPRTWDEYHETCAMLVSQLGKARLVADLGPGDFARLRDGMTKRWGPVRVGNAVQRVRSVFKYAYAAGLIAAPVRYGPEFARPSKKTLRLQRARQGARLLTADEIRRMIDGAGQPLLAMILLGINCGLGNSDCGNLPLTALDLDNGWMDFPRPKTGMPRRCSLWPETVKALREALANRPHPKDAAEAGLAFVTKYGLSWAKDTRDNPISKETKKLLNALGINGRSRLGFYTLRHTFRTVADGAKDQPAADYIMGHEVAHMSSVYRETISDERLKAVADHVRKWLFSAQPAQPTPDRAERDAPTTDEPAHVEDRKE